jgi:hypothetical protein
MYVLGGMDTTRWDLETRKDVRDGCLWEKVEVGKERKKNRGGGGKKLLSVDFFSRR